MKFADKINDKRLKLGLGYRDIFKILKPRIHGLKIEQIRLWFEDKLLPDSYELKILSECLKLNYEDLENVLIFGHKLGPIQSRPESKMELSKVSKPPKTKKIGKPNILKPPNEKHCRWCDIEHGHECYRHPEDETIKYLSGGGHMGGKSPDQFAVWGCASCDIKYSNKPDKKDYVANLEHSLKWSTGIFKTWLI